MKISRKRLTANDKHRIKKQLVHYLNSKYQVEYEHLVKEIVNLYWDLVFGQYINNPHMDILRQYDVAEQPRHLQLSIEGEIDGKRITKSFTFPLFELSYQTWVCLYEPAKDLWIPKDAHGIWSRPTVPYQNFIEFAIEYESLHQAMKDEIDSTYSLKSLHEVYPDFVEFYMT